MTTSFEELLERLVKNQVKFALTGGLAVCLNGYVRLTDDVDILVDNSPENVQRLAECLATFGDGHGGDLTPTDLTNEPGAIRIYEDFVLDVFVQMNGKILSDFSESIGLYKLRSGVEIPYLRSRALIETKRGSVRDRDQYDIAALSDIERARLAKNIPAAFDLDSVRSEPGEN